MAYLQGKIIGGVFGAFPNAPLLVPFSLLIPLHASVK
jgi:hypothetical protein